MPRNPAQLGLAGKLRRSGEIDRQIRVRPRGHTESKTFIVGAAISISTYIPPFFVGLDHDDRTPEWKLLLGFAAQLRAGTATLSWLHNDVTILSGHPVSTSRQVRDLTLPRELAHGDTIRPVITASGSGSGLAAAAFIVTGVP